MFSFSPLQYWGDKYLPLAKCGLDKATEHNFQRGPSTLRRVPLMLLHISRILLLGSYLRPLTFCVGRRWNYASDPYLRRILRSACIYFPDTEGAT